MNEPFRILVVSVGNDCRSPLAERHLRHKFSKLLGHAADAVEVTSAGVRAVVGAPIDPLAAQELQRLGGTPHGFAARQLTRQMMQESDLVLTATRVMRSRVLEDEPSALRRTFTLREFASLARLLQPVGSPQDFVVKAAAHRWAVGVDDYDVPDPSARYPRKYREAADQISDASDAITQLWSQMLTPSGSAV